jgi:hypothetical protein
VLAAPLWQRPIASMMAIGDALMAVIYVLYLVGFIEAAQQLSELYRS